VKTVMNLQVLQKAANFFTSWATIRIHQHTSPHTVFPNKVI
jgi:hypothetical protein